MAIYKDCPLLLFRTTNSEGIPKQNIYMHIKENSIPPCRNGPPEFVQMENFHLTHVRSRQNQVRSH